MAPPLKTSADNFAALRQQVIGLESDYQELKGVVVGVSNEMRAGFTAINQKLDARSITPWSLYISGFVALLVLLGMLGTVLYVPIKSTQDEMKDQQRRDAQASYDRDVRFGDRHRALQSEVDFMKGALAPLLKR